MTENWPHPYLAIDAAVLSVINREVVVLVHERRGDDAGPLLGWGLPGAYLQEGERIDDARARLLREKCGFVATPRFRSLTPRDEPGRDPRRHTVSLPSWAPVTPDELAPLSDEARIALVRPRGAELQVEIDDESVTLAVDHHMIVAEAVLALAGEVDHLEPDSAAMRSLLPDPFTSRDVEDILTAILAIDGRPAPETNALRRRLSRQTVETGDVESLAAGQRHRPAALRRWSDA